ncbi:hypothetical protein L226DRAFT_577055 [Lentinus tigrinus ALCF2SS1-7]|uniref:uncharacterized protein n=1 Tax=Lentinus tigrinus ALCF2SS1-7 TaxID=1328758 RepID=UPI001165FD2A|nr:hypothetical protein L226DRAFT_577055 [Lentinus tigrinus ALCF2SS1-7]
MSPWHTTTGWYSWLADKQPQDIFPYSDHPKAAQEQWTTVIDWVHCFFDYAYHLPSASSELALQILNTEAGNSEFNHTPFGPHQMGDTQQAYRQLFTQFIIFLIRIADSTSNYDLKLPVDVQEALQEFQQLALTPTASYQASGVQEFICNILIALWTKTYPPVGRTLFNDPTIRFIMHTQVKPDLSLKDPHQVTGILAKMTYCMRLAFLAYAHQQFDPETPENTLATEVRSLQPWFTVGQESTFHTIRSLQHRASALVMSSQNEPNMAWKDGSDYTVMIFKGGQVSLPNLISCQAALEDRSIHILLHDLLFDHNFSIDISRLRDDMGNSDPDYSLFTDRVNRPVLGPVDRLAQHILDTPALCERFVLAIENGEVIWNAVNLSIWLSTYTQFNLLCLVQVEMNCGAPGRTTELTAMPRVNTRTGMLRALRIIDGHIALMRTYHKMRAAQGRDRVIPHSLNASLGAMMVYKEALCQPFAQLCASVLFPEDVKVKRLYQDFLFTNYNKPFTGDDLSNAMKSWTNQYIGFPLGVHDWRQVSTPFRRQHAGLEEMYLQEDLDTPDAAQAGHSHRVDWLRYGVTNLAATGLPEDYIKPFLATSKRWHIALKLVPGGELTSLRHSLHRYFVPPPPRAQPAVAGAVNLEALAELVAVQLQPQLAAMQQAITAATTASFTAFQTQLLAQLQQMHGGQKPHQQSQQEGMIFYHNIDDMYYDPVPPPPIQPQPAPVPSSPPPIPFQSRPPTTATSPAPRNGPALALRLTTAQPKAIGPSSALPAPVSRPAVIPALPPMPIGPMPTENQALQTLRQVLQKNDAQWRNEGQKQAVMAAVQWQKDLVVILPTGSGKSAVVATAARLESNKITAVFLPLRSLLSDWKRRLTLLDYPFEVYNPSRPHLSGQTPIVLVSLDAAGGTSWQQAVTSLRSDVRLNRMVFDEAHLVLTEGSYRGIMNQVKELRIAHVQFVLLSATIPPISISHLATSFTLATGDNTQVIRTVSNRPELSFKGPTTYDHLDSETLDLISLEVRTTLNIVSKNPVNRVLVFVQTVANGLVVAERLECEFYRGSSDKSLTNQDRENIAQRWYDGTYKVMVATDAFGPGNDYPSVRTLHWF